MNRDDDKGLESSRKSAYDPTRVISRPGQSLDSNRFISNRAAPEKEHEHDKYEENRITTPTSTTFSRQLDKKGIVHKTAVGLYNSLDKVSDRICRIFPPKSEIFNEIKDIRGWLSDKETDLLYGKAQSVNPENAIVEIGSWCGRSSIVMAKGAARGAKDGQIPNVYAVDPHMQAWEQRTLGGDSWSEFNRNIEEHGVKEQVTPIKKDSFEASREFDKPIGLLFVDGDARYAPVKQDLSLWMPKVVNGGTIAIHDVNMIFPGKILNAARLLLTSNQIRNPQTANTITCFEKCEKNTVPERIKNAAYVLPMTIKGSVGYLNMLFRGGSRWGIQK